MKAALRMTHQREIILHELQRCKIHPTADELYDRIKKKLPRISLATVYRNLEILSETGVIQKLEISGRQKRFDWNPATHNHIHCIRCHRIDDIFLSEAPAAAIEPIEQQGYEVTGIRIEFFGLCPQCQQKTQTKQRKGEQPMACPTCVAPTLSDTQRKVLEALASSGEACGSKELATATGLESKQVSCQITALKNKGLVESPVRCKYTITEQGRSMLG